MFSGVGRTTSYIHGDRLFNVRRRNATDRWTQRKIVGNTEHWRQQYHIALQFQKVGFSRAAQLYETGVWDEIQTSVAHLTEHERHFKIGRSVRMRGTLRNDSAETDTVAEQTMEGVRDDISCHRFWLKQTDLIATRPNLGSMNLQWNCAEDKLNFSRSLGNGC